MVFKLAHVIHATQVFFLFVFLFILLFTFPVSYLFKVYIILKFVM